MKTYSFDHYKIILDDPIPVISGGTYEEHQWGPYQFPGLAKTRNGHIMLTCAPPKAQDSVIGYEGTSICGKASEDGGATWRDIREDDIPVGVIMQAAKNTLSPGPKMLSRLRGLTNMNRYFPERLSDYTVLTKFRSSPEILKQANMIL